MAVQLAAAWWKKNKQVGVTGKELMSALEKFEKKKKTAVARNVEKDWQDILKLLDGIDSAADKTKAKCNAKLQKKTIEILVQMKKQTSLERKTAEQMIHAAAVHDILESKLEASRKLVTVAKKVEKIPGQLMKALTPLAKNIPGWIKQKDKKNLSETLRTMTKLKGEVKKLAPVTKSEYSTLLDINTRTVNKLKSVPKDLDALIKEIKSGNVYCQKVVVEAKKVSGDFDSLNTWFEKQLMALKK